MELHKNNVISIRWTCLAD